MLSPCDQDTHQLSPTRRLDYNRAMFKPLFKKGDIDVEVGHEPNAKDGG